MAIRSLLSSGGSARDKRADHCRTIWSTGAGTADPKRVITDLIRSIEAEI